MKNKSTLIETEKLKAKNAELRQQLKELKDSIKTIKAGNIDALVIPDKKNIKIFTEKTADKTYRILIEKMNEGAVALNESGTIIYCNSHFATMMNLPLQKVIGTKFKKFIRNSKIEHFNELVKQARQRAIKSEMYIYSEQGNEIPVLMAMTDLNLENTFAVSIIITDLTEQYKNQKKLKIKTLELKQKNIELQNVNKELGFQNEEKEKRAAELIIANKELIFQNEEKEKRAAELSIANKELIIQNKEKEKRAAELIIAIKELAFQNEEKEKRAAELSIANKELAFQNEEKEKRAAELIIANKELAFQNEEKEKRAAELRIANKELIIQNKEKEKRAKELSIANKDLTTFTYVSSHDLQEPLRKIQNFVTVILLEDEKRLSETGKSYFLKMRETAKRMQALIEDLLTYSRTKSDDRIFENTNLNLILDEVLSDLDEIIKEKSGTIEAKSLGNANVIRFQFRQLFQNLISNSLKFAKPGVPPHILVESKLVNGDKAINKNLSRQKKYLCISFTDNGIGFDPQYENRIFEVFQRLHTSDKYKGTGIGLAICKRIVENHKGIILATGKPNKGTIFNIYLPA